MRVSKGGFRHEDILKLTWRQFGTYLDAFTFVLREESGDPDKDNFRDDLEADGQDPRVREWKRKFLEDTKRDVEKHKKYASGPTGGITQKLLE